MQQTTNTILMVRPTSFRANEQTAVNNHYQKEMNDMAQATLQEKANQEFDAFVEKPDEDTARSYLEEGNYYWNSGMFMFKASKYLDELKTYNPEMYTSTELSLASALTDMDFTRLDRDAFSKCPSDSIDYAVMEKTNDAALIPVDIGWNDIGSWSALWDVGTSDESGNVTMEM